jgi:hypothetical protein
MSTIHHTISVGSGAAAIVVPANLTGTRLALWIQSYGAPDYAANPTLWAAFGQAAVAGGAGSWQITAGGVYVWGAASLFSPSGARPSSICPNEYVSIISQSGTVVGAIIEELST